MVIEEEEKPDFCKACCVRFAKLAHELSDILDCKAEGSAGSRSPTRECAGNPVLELGCDEQAVRLVRRASVMAVAALFLII